MEETVDLALRIHKPYSISFTFKLQPWDTSFRLGREEPLEHAMLILEVVLRLFTFTFLLVVLGRLFSSFIW